MTTESSRAFSLYLDSDGLIGSGPNPSKWSTGNALMETSIACLLETLINGRASDLDFLIARKDAILSCQSDNGLFNKNPGRRDQITHDDLISIASTQRVCGFPFADMIASFGQNHEWALSNTNQWYWDACAKPWDKAFYLMAKGLSPAWYESLAMAVSVLVNGWCGDVSNNRLAWIMSESIKGISADTDLVFFIWKKLMKKKYGDLGVLMLQYYGKPEHPFVIFGSKVLF